MCKQVSGEAVFYYSDLSCENGEWAGAMKRYGAFLSAVNVGGTASSRWKTFDVSAQIVDSKTTQPILPAATPR
jgi:hypothetical protein